MMTGALLVQAGLMLGVAILSALVRSRPFRLAWGLLDVMIVLFIPGIGFLLVVAALILEAAFRRSLRGRPAEAPEEEQDPFGRAPAPLEEIRIGTSVSPFSDLLASADLEEIDRAMRRLARADHPATLSRLKEALHSPRNDVRVRARGLLVRLEDHLLERVQSARDPLVRARACRKMAFLSSNPVTAGQHLRRAAAAYRQALLAKPASGLGLELGRVLLLQGEWESAREALSAHLRLYPCDAEARLARAEASLQLRDVDSARKDCVHLGFEQKGSA